MQRIMLTVAYDGTNYKGFAEQLYAPTIEGTLNRALTGVTGEPIKVIGASRTDAGVHAYGNLVVFDTDSPIPADRFSYAVNHMLPDDIRVISSRSVPSDFHPRHCHSVKTYEYRILNAENPIPTQRLYSYYNNMHMDLDKMNLAGSYLVGEHDFTSFCNTDTQAKSHIRTLYEVTAERGTDIRNDMIIIRVRGNGFLYNMVRIIAGTLMQIGSGKGMPEDVVSMLEKRARSAAGPTAPACGLFLIGYEIDIDKR